MTRLLDGRSAVVVGSSQGIGLEVARLLAAEGCAVVLNGRGEAALSEALSGLRSEGHTVAAIAGSAADPEVAQALVAAADDLAPLGAVVTCAGTAEPPGSSILSVSSEQWRDLIDAHLGTTFEACRAAAPVLVRNGGGAIVTTSSHAFSGIFGGTGYAAGKGAVNSLTYALAAELREHHVRVNAVCPGARTRLSSGDDYTTTIEDLHQRGILDDLMHAGALAPPPPAYVAPLYAYLAGPLSAGTTGEVLVAAGGYLGRFERPAEQFLAYRDHTNEPPWTPQEVAAQLKAAARAT